MFGDKSLVVMDYLGMADECEKPQSLVGYLLGLWLLVFILHCFSIRDI